MTPRRSALLVFPRSVPGRSVAKALSALAALWTSVAAPLLQAQSCPAELGGYPLYQDTDPNPVNPINQVKCEKNWIPGVTRCVFQCLYPRPGILENLSADVTWIVLDERADVPPSPQSEFCNANQQQSRSEFRMINTPERKVYAQANGPANLLPLAVALAEELLRAVEPQAIPCAGARPPPPVDEGPEPVIFVPGFMGSQMRAADGSTIWPPLGPGASRGWHLAGVWQDLVWMSLNPGTKHGRLEATDAFRYDGTASIYGGLLSYLTETGGYAEYNVHDEPSRRTLEGCTDSTATPKPTLFVFAYDWRQQVEDNAKLLADYVRCILTFHPGRKVNIVTHSMGGLVARRFILDYPGQVDKLITIAAPFLGAPKVLFQMENGLLSVDMNGLVLSGLPSGDPGGAVPDFGGPRGAVKEMEAFYPGLHELLPSPAYFNAVGAPSVMYSDTTAHFVGLGVSFRPLTVDELLGPDGLINSRFPEASRNGKRPAESNRDFHEYVNPDGERQDDWSRDNTGVRYFHLIGVQAALSTVVSLHVMKGAELLIANTGSFIVAPTPTGPGDGTVPLLSAARIGKGNNLNAPDARLFLYAGPNALDGNPDVTKAPNVRVIPEDDDSLLDHAEIVNNPRVQEKVLQLLLDRTPGESRLRRPAAMQPAREVQYRLRFNGRQYLTYYRHEVENGVAIDNYFYPFLLPDGRQAEQNGERLWMRFVRVPAADQPNQGTVVWWLATWTLRNGVWERFDTPNVEVEVMERVP